jgi:hypothetical protein
MLALMILMACDATAPIDGGQSGENPALWQRWPLDEDDPRPSDWDAEDVLATIHDRVGTLQWTGGVMGPATEDEAQVPATMRVEPGEPVWMWDTQYPGPDRHTAGVVLYVPLNVVLLGDNLVLTASAVLTATGEGSPPLRAVEDVGGGWGTATVDERFLERADDAIAAEYGAMHLLDFRVAFGGTWDAPTFGIDAVLHSDGTHAYRGVVNLREGSFTPDADAP